MENKEFVFGKQNFIVFAIAIAVIVIGFCLMSGGGSTDKVSYNPEIFSARRIVIAPIVTLAGYALVVYGILMKQKQGAAE